ncbi:expressed protein [Chlorella variabilis]|uniref:Expressed protein n=1 Tax=Chlorella variabilis TaxID=554065 RepID=E1ZR86_CHLVA|nr:expressed protein [Chlorella variabilis]EFN51735.1 expressed protein [Chlorella variabilis]|eukprot:XP_005843837.1 expressed protein [Chlorella variabilis]
MAALPLVARTGLPRPAAAAPGRHRGAPAAAPLHSSSRRRPQPAQQPPPRRLEAPRAAVVDVDVGEEEEEPLSSVDIESLEYAGGSYSVQGCLVTPACPNVVYQVLTDYEALTRVFHNVQSSAVRTCAHTGAKQLVQTCKWAFLVFSGTFVHELNVVEEPEQRQLTFSLAHSAFMREFVGSWDVRGLPGGMTEVRHRLSVTPTVAPPQRIGDLSKCIFRKQVVGILEDLDRELEARAGRGSR